MYIPSEENITEKPLFMIQRDNSNGFITDRSKRYLMQFDDNYTFQIFLPHLCSQIQ